jgi:hypothetical protein
LMSGIWKRGLALPRQISTLHALGVAKAPGLLDKAG